MSTIASKVTRHETKRKTWTILKRNKNKYGNQFSNCWILESEVEFSGSYYNYAQDHEGKYVDNVEKDTKSQQINKNTVSKNKNTENGFNLRLLIAKVGVSEPEDISIENNIWKARKRQKNLLHPQRHY